MYKYRPFSKLGYPLELSIELKESENHRVDLKDDFIRISNDRNRSCTMDLNILSSNVRSFNNKKASIEDILNSKSVDIGVFSEINTKRIPRFKGFTSFTKYSKKRFHGVSIFVSNNIASRVIRIPD